MIGLARSLRRARIDRWIERELVLGLSARGRARLHEQLRRDPQARARYDRAACALRVLEGDGFVAPSELDVVGRWLLGAPEAQAHAQATRAGAARRWWPAVGALVAAALVLLWVRPMTEQGALAPALDDGWQARGGGAYGALAIEALCSVDPGPAPEPATGEGTPAGDAADEPLRVEVRARDCRSRDLLGFAYRTEPDVTGVLTLFGVDAEGDPMFYLPTPNDPEGASTLAGRWHALPLAVRLSINHAAGPLRIYGVVAPRVASVAQVRAWAEHLAAQPAARPGDAPWIQRVPASSRESLCSDPRDCHAAELRLTVVP